MSHILWWLPGLNPRFWWCRAQITTIHTTFRIATATGGQGTAVQGISAGGTRSGSGGQGAQTTQSMPGIGGPASTTT